MQELEELKEVILSTTDFLIAYMDREFNFIEVNQAYADAGRRNREDFIGKNHFDLYPHEENERIFRSVVVTINTTPTMLVEPVWSAVKWYSLSL